MNHVRYGSLFLFVAGTYAASPPLGAWTSNNVAPAIRRATAIAFFLTCANLGSIFSTWLFGTISPAPRYTAATITLLVFQIGVLVCAVATRFYLARANGRKAKARLHADGEKELEKDMGEMTNESIWFEYVM